MSSRILMRASLCGEATRGLVPSRSVSPKDAVGLGHLMYAAYFGTADYDGETPGQAAEEIEKTLRGEYGEFSPECSKAIDRNGRVVAAVLVTHFRQRPFVAFSMTDPEFQRQGLGMSCMLAAMGALQGKGETELTLVVTLANAPAVALYAKLGFRKVGAA